ncbi:MAG: hypothetical protein RIK87_09235 [Fuerstiella sp.]
MADTAEIHELLESVRVTLNSSMNPNREELERLHSELDAEIRMANKRLRECDALLAEGHRSEAIQLAEQEPNLLEVVSILDFPELPEWNDFVAELGLTVTPELQIDIATDLNGAYSDDAPLERLLRKFRVLSLGRAPLRSRIDVLRQIAKRDAGTAYWQDDLKTYEQTRIRQIADESREAVASRDLATVRRLSEEIHKKPWLVKPDRRIVERLDKLMKEVRELDAVRALNSLTKQFHAAEQVGDIDLGRSLAEKWKAAAQKCNSSSDGFLEAQAEAEPMFRWIAKQSEAEEEERQFAAEVRKLQKVLRSPSSTMHEIYRHYDRVADYEGFEIPDAVQDKFEARILEYEKQQNKKKMMTIGGVVVGVIVLLGIAWVLIF